MCDIEEGDPVVLPFGDAEIVGFVETVEPVGNILDTHRLRVRELGEKRTYSAHHTDVEPLA